MSTVRAVSFNPKATRKRLKKEILSDDFKKRKIFWKNIAENFPYGKIFYGKLSMENFPPHITSEPQLTELYCTCVDTDTFFVCKL
jgi:hypothetical protein